MKKRRVTIDLDALRDFTELYRWIALSGAPRAAGAYVRRIQKYARSLGLASERGSSLARIDPALRSIPFETVVLAVRVSADEVLVVRVLHASRGWARELKRDAQTRVLNDKFPKD